MSMCDTECNLLFPRRFNGIKHLEDMIRKHPLSISRSIL